MFKSGQIVYDTSIEEPVIFIEGVGDYSDVVCTGVEDESADCKTKDLVPIWNDKDHVLVGKLAAKNFATVLKITKANYKKYANYIHEVSLELSNDGKIKELRYHTK